MPAVGRAARTRLRRVGRLAVVAVVLVALGGVAETASAAQTSEPVRVVTKEFDPFVVKTGTTYDGFSIDLLEEIMSRLGLDYDLTAKDTVADVLKDVEEDRADLGIAGISITRERERSVDFSYPIYNSGLHILVPEGAESSGLGKTVAVLFTRPVLQLMGLLVLLMVAMAHVVWLLERTCESDFPRTYRRGIMDGVWWSAVTMTTVGYGDKTPRSVYGRIAGIIWMFVAIVLFANLTATAASSLTVQGLEGSIHGPEDLPGKTLATVRGTSSVDYLSKFSSNKVETATISDAYQLLIDGKVDAVVFDSPVLLAYAAGKGKGEVQVVGPVFARQDYGIALPTGSARREDINSTLLQIVEDGTYREIQERWFGPTA